MKSEPDRLDLLIVVLPILLVTVLGLQIYRLSQVTGEREAGVRLAEEVLAAMAPAPTEPAPSPGGPTADATAGGDPDDSPEESSPEEADEPGAEPAGEAEAAIADPEAPVEGSDAGEESASATGDGSAVSPDSVAAGEGTGPVVSEEPVVSQEEPEPIVTPAPAEPGDRAGVDPGPAAGTLTVPVAFDSSGEPPADTGAADTPAPTGSTDAPGTRSMSTSASVDPAAPAQVRAVSMIPDAKTGQVIPVEIRISNAHDVFGVPFHLAFDPTVVTLNESPRGERGPFLDVGGSQAQFLVAPGSVDGEIVVGLSLLGSTPGGTGSGLLATIFLKAVSPGTTSLEFSRATVRGGRAKVLPAEFHSGTILVTP